VAGFVRVMQTLYTCRETFPQKLSSKETVSDNGQAASLLWIDVTDAISQLWVPRTHSPQSSKGKVDVTNGCLSQKPKTNDFTLTDCSTMVAPSPNYAGRHSREGQTSGLKP